MKKHLLLPLLALMLPGSALAQSRLAATTPAGEDAADRIALVRERLHVAIDQQYARTRLQQVFHNRMDEQLEGRYHLQLGEGARVQGFSYWNGEQKIVGEVFEKQTATAVYEEVTGLDRDPGLLEQEGEGAFSFRLFPIQPEERKRVELSYGQWLARTGQMVEYRASLGQGGEPGSQVVREIELDIADDRGIAEVTSSTHAIDVERKDAGRVLVRVQAGNGTGVGNGGPELAVRYRVQAKDWALSAFVHRDPGHDGYLVATVAAPDDLGDREIAAKDVTLVLDRSGSMSGEPLTRARLAALAVVERLRPADRLNVIAFDDDVDLLFSEPRPVTEANRGEALAYIQRIGDGGGTNLALALERALAAQAKDDASRPHVILFLTDGQSDAQATLRVAQADAGDARVFTIGVGDGVEKPLLSRLAAIKRGRFTFIESPGVLERKVSRLYAQIESPVMVGVSVDVEPAGGAGGAGVGGARLARTYPRTLPDLFRGDELVIASRIVSQPGPVILTMRGEVGGKPVVFKRELMMPEAEKRPWTGRLWAQARVDDLLEEIALYGENDELTGEVIDLALAYNFVTPYTSFLAIPESELTDGARDALASARDRKQQILAKHQDAVALSRSAMPPGDPILKVRAPADARQVTAYFPFGLVKDLTYDADSEHWRVRFLVPKQVVDGDYEVKIVVVRADGTVEVAQVPYTIDSEGPEFEVSVEPGKGGVLVKVTTAEQARLVTVCADGAPGLRLELKDDGDGLHFQGFLAVPPGKRVLRVVVADMARNEGDELVSVDVTE